MLGLTGTAKQLEQAFSRIGTGLKLAVGGAAGIMAGIGIEKGLMDIARAGENLLHQQSIMLRNGLSMATVAGLTADAYDRIAKAVPTAPADAILRTESELRSVIGSTDEAVKATPFALKLDALVENVTGKVSEGAGFAIWRALEMKGITASNPDLTSKLAETMARIIGASSGKVTADSYNQFAKRGGIAWINASPEFIAGAGSNLVGDFGGDTGGTALATFYNTMSGAAQLTRQQVDILEKSGMLDPTKVHKVKGSNAMQMDPGAIKGWLQYEHDPDQFVQQVLAPALHALANKDSATGMGKADDIYDNLIGKLGRNKNTQRLMKLWGDPGFRAQIDKDLSIWSGAMGLDPAYATMMGDGQAMGAIDPSQAAHGAKPVIDNAKPPGDYMAVMKAFTAQWNSMMEAVGGPVAQALIPTLKTITDSFTQLGSWANTHSAEVQTMTKVMEALGVAIVDFR
jgi:hypothetical protein